MKKFITLTISLTLMFTMLFIQGSSAMTIKSQGRVGMATIKKQAKGYMLHGRLFAIAENNGNVFYLTRNANVKSRDLGWMLYDVKNAKILKTGKCPFKTENAKVAISRNADFAAAFSSFPSALWVLDVKAGEWKKLYENPPVDKDGLVIRTHDTATPLMFLDNNKIGSILNYYDKKTSQVKNIVSVFGSYEEGGIHESISLKDMFKMSNALLKEKGITTTLNSGTISIIGEDQVAYIMRSKARATNYLFTAKKGEKAVLVATSKNDIVFNDANGKNILYSEIDQKAKKQALYLFNGKESLKCTDCQFASPKLLDDGTVTYVAVNPKIKTASLMAGAAGAAKKIVSDNGNHLFYILRNGSLILFINQNEMVWYELNK